MKLMQNVVLILLNAVHIGTSFKIGFDVYERLAPLAALERGYEGAVGGEALAAIGAGVIVYIILDKLICAVLEFMLSKIKK